MLSVYIHVAYNCIDFKTASHFIHDYDYMHDYNAYFIINYLIIKFHVKNVQSITESIADIPTF